MILSFLIDNKKSKIPFSFFLSNEEVGSSSKIRSGSFITALKNPILSLFSP